MSLQNRLRLYFASSVQRQVRWVVAMSGVLAALVFVLFSSSTI